MAFYVAEGVKDFRGVLAAGTYNVHTALPGLGSAIRVRKMSLSCAGGANTDTLTLRDTSPADLLTMDALQAPLVIGNWERGQEIYRLAENLGLQVVIAGAANWTIYIEYEVT